MDNDENRANEQPSNEQPIEETNDQPEIVLIPDEPPQKKRRARRSRAEIEAAGGTVRAKSETTLKLDRKVFANQLSAAHGILAAATKSPVWAITKDEASQLSDGIVGVLEQYDIRVGAKALAWSQLVATCATIYGMRAYMAYAAAKQRDKIRSNVTTSTPGFVNGVPIE